MQRDAKQAAVAVAQRVRPEIEQQRLCGGWCVFVHAPHLTLARDHPHHRAARLLHHLDGIEESVTGKRVLHEEPAARAG